MASLAVFLQPYLSCLSVIHNLSFRDSVVGHNYQCLNEAIWQQRYADAVYYNSLGLAIIEEHSLPITKSYVAYLYEYANALSSNGNFVKAAQVLVNRNYSEAERDGRLLYDESIAKNEGTKRVKQSI